MGNGVLFVISAPSGAGKSTLIQRVRPQFPQMRYSISCTTRPPRNREINGVHYFFVSREQFEQMIREGEFLEWKEVHGNLYGTPARPVTDALDQGDSVILDIDVQGAADVFKRCTRAVGVFVTAPTMQVLEKRLRSRGTDSEESIQTRLKNAVQEMERAHLFTYRIVNENLERAAAELAHIIEKESAAGSSKPIQGTCR